jgi:hypothetical protein
VVSNSDINWKDEEPTDVSTIIPLINRMLRTDSDLAFVSGADELINTAERLFRETLAGSQINLAERERTLNSPAYRQARVNRRQVYDKLANPEGYRFIDYRDRNFASALAEETGIQRTMYVEFNFTKAFATAIARTGTCRAILEMTVYVYDGQGKRFYKKSFPMWSLSTISVTAGAYSHTELIGLFETIIVEACQDFLDDLGK